MTVSIRPESQQILEQLPPEGLAELTNFIEFLGFKYHLPGSVESEPPLNPEADPLLQVIGVAEVEPLAQDIDDLLYGPAQP